MLLTQLVIFFKKLDFLKSTVLFHYLIVGILCQLYLYGNLGKKRKDEYLPTKWLLKEFSGPGLSLDPYKYNYTYLQTFALRNLTNELFVEKLGLILYNTASQAVRTKVNVVHG